MNRKNIILIAVFINAGLITAMLIAGLTSHDEQASGLAVAEEGRNLLDENPLFGDSLDLALRKPSDFPEVPTPLSLPEFEKNASPALAQLPIPAPENQIVHKLPPLSSSSNAIPASPVSSPVSQTVAQTPAQPASPFLEITVKKGDHLEKIAKAHRTTVDQIIKINQLPSSFLKVGQQLKVPVESTAAVSQPGQKQTAPERKPSETPSEYYTVKVGDNPWTIAMKHHIKVEELLRLNGLNEEKARKLKPGDRLRTR